MESIVEEALTIAVSALRESKSSKLQQQRDFHQL